MFHLLNYFRVVVAVVIRLVLHAKCLIFSGSCSNGACNPKLFCNCVIGQKLVLL